MYEKLTVVL